MIRRGFVAVLFTLVALLTLPAAGQSTFGAIAGTVKDTRGRPTRNAVVRIVGGPTTGSVRTNGDGTYRLGDLPAGVYDIVAQKTGYASVRRGTVEVAAGRTNTQQFVLEWSDPTRGGIEVQVLDLRGTPLRDAQVGVHVGITPVVSGTTDEAGTVIFAGLPPAFYNLFTQRPGFLERITRNISVSPGGLTSGIVRLEPDLRAVGRFNGLIQDPAGVPIPNARVQITSGLTRKETRTAANGRYELTELFPGSDYALDVSAAGFAGQNSTGLGIRVGEATVVNFTLVPLAPAKGSLRGRIRSTNGAPIPFATVTMTAGPALGQEVTADVNGDYLFDPLDPGTAYAIVARSTGFNPAGRSGLAIRSGQTLVVNLELRPIIDRPGILSGAVQDAGTGQVLTDVLVELVRGPSTGLSALTSGSGQYLLEGVIPGDSHALRFSKSGYEPLVLGPFRVNPGATTTVNARLAPIAGPSGAIGGTVRSGGSLVSGAKVTLFAGPGAPRTFTTGTDGRYQFTGLRAGTEFGVRVEKAGFNNAEQRGIVVRDGQSVTVDFVLVPSVEVGAIAGRVVDLLRRPIPGARVRVIEGPALPSEIVVNSAGEFRFNNLPRGTYILEAVATGFANARTSGVIVAPRSTTVITILMLSR
jgi:hypothetical protein